MSERRSSWTKIYTNHSVNLRDSLSFFIPTHFRNPTENFAPQKAIDHTDRSLDGPIRVVVDFFCSLAVPFRHSLSSNFGRPSCLIRFQD